MSDVSEIVTHQSTYSLHLNKEPILIELTVEEPNYNNIMTEHKSKRFMLRHWCDNY